MGSLEALHANTRFDGVPVPDRVDPDVGRHTGRAITACHEGHRRPINLPGTTGERSGMTKVVIEHRKQVVFFLDQGAVFVEDMPGMAKDNPMVCEADPLEAQV